MIFDGLKGAYSYIEHLSFAHILTGALLSSSHGTREYQPRGEHDCRGGALIGELAVSSALIAICRWNTNNLQAFVFEPALLLRTPRRHKPSFESVHVPQAQENSLQSALHRAAQFIKQHS